MLPRLSTPATTSSLFLFLFRLYPHAYSASLSVHNAYTLYIYTDKIKKFNHWKERERGRFFRDEKLAWSMDKQVHITTRYLENM